jgi:hypothetical protein
MVRRESTPQQRKPPDLPPDWLHVWNEIDSHSDEWGRRAALFVGAYRLTTGQGPTFAELFAELTPELAILRFEPEQNFKQRHAVRNRFMVEVVSLFARRQWTNFSSESRSLKLGPKGHQMQHSEFRTYSAQFAGKAHYCRTHYCTKHLRRTGADVLWRSGQTVDPSRCSQSGGSSGSKSLSHCPEPGMGQSVGAVRPW